MNPKDWISVKEGAEHYGLDYKTFLENYCQSKGKAGDILARMGGLRVLRTGKGGKRTLLVSRPKIDSLIAQELHQEAS
jgi:hypothetical protein